MATREVAFSELLSAVVDNRGRSCPTAPSGIPLIATNCIRNELLFPTFEHARFVSQNTYSTWFRGHPIPGDILFVNKATPGRVCLVPDPVDFCIAQDMVAVRADPAKIYPRYLFAALRSRLVQERIATMHVGTLIPHFKKGDFDKLMIPVPDRPKQEFIGDTYYEVSAKIDLNRRMNRTLEAIARVLFRSWFVDFDPVRAKSEGRDPGLPPHLADLFPDSFEASELGEIPTGWRDGHLRDVLAELVSGARPRGGAVGDGVPSIGAENVIGLGRYGFSSEKFVPRAFFEQLKLRGAAVRHGDVLLYKDGAGIGRKTYFEGDFPHSECAINEHVFILRSRSREWQRFLFFWLDQDLVTNDIVSLNSNSAQPGINQHGVRGLRVLVPDDGVIGAFDQLVAPLIGRLFANCQESRTLAASRDVLLPRLISGELRLGSVA